jgi:uncharacterized membrane protein
MEDSVSKRAYLIAAVFAAIHLFTANTVVFRLDNTTVVAGLHIAVGLLEHIVQTRVIVWE